MRKLLFFWRTGKYDLRALWFALKHPERPRWLLPATIALVVYALAPFNFIIPVVGIADDFILVPLLMHFVLKMLPPRISQDFNVRNSRARRA
jgi:uncharacterized membrane protein YkvA (DUF1232 family)